ncbi:MAG TPA: glycosyltransferase family 39 protein [Chthoniobacterales bacterium]|nr:glycosyltransferase family 39 protein [Chthoniobacterales bacterium]
MNGTQTRATSSFARRGADYFGTSSVAEFVIAAVLFAVLSVFKIIYILHYRFDSDEPQHLHVIWAWTHGLVQYRDVFDNHMPLFHVLFAPIFLLVDERATALVWMRFILLPMYFVAAWCTYQIGTRLFSRRAGIWAVVLTGCYASYYFTSLEFRTDNLWAPFWLLSVTVLLQGRISVRRGLVAGLLLGFCFGISMKSTLLLFSLFLGACVALLLTGRSKLGVSRPQIALSTLVFLAAMSIIPAVIMFFFAVNGIWPQLFHDVFEHNLFAPLQPKPHLGRWIAISLVALPLVIYVARKIVRASRDPLIGFSRALLVIFCAIYFLVLKGFWPLSTRQDFLPYDPLAFVIGSAALLAISDGVARSKIPAHRLLRYVPIPIFIAATELLLAFSIHPFWIDHTKPETHLLRDVLALTKPDDYVFDCKGETVFRQRCFRPVLETITKKRIQLGMMVDDVPQRCIETHTCVAVTLLFEKISSGTRQFVERNYLPVSDNLRVAGAILKPSVKDPLRFDFDVVIPASYKIISRDGNVSGALDGSEYNGARFLAAGPHTFDSTSTAGPYICLWAQAVDRNFTPFRLISRFKGNSFADRPYFILN